METKIIKDFLEPEQFKDIKEKGMSIIPLRLFSNEKGKIKLEIALAKGKKTFDKRESIKEKDIKRDIQRLTKLK